MSEIKTNIFFKSIPESLSHFFKNSSEPWSALKGDLKDSFSTSNKIEGDVSPLAHIEGKGVIIEKGAKVEAYAYIKGPCFIGSGTEVRHGAYIRGNVYVGRNCVVGHSTEIKHSIFLDGAKAGHFNYIGDSVLGCNVNLGAGTKIANLKITPGNVSLKVEGKQIDSGLKKFGAIIGDNVETGCNSVLNPGTLLAANSKVFPLASAFGVHLKKTLIKN